MIVSVNSTLNHSRNVPQNPKEKQMNIVDLGRSREPKIVLLVDGSNALALWQGREFWTPPCTCCLQEDEVKKLKEIGKIHGASKVYFEGGGWEVFPKRRWTTEELDLLYQG